MFCVVEFSCSAFLGCLFSVVNLIFYIVGFCMSPNKSEREYQEAEEDIKKHEKVDLRIFYRYFALSLVLFFLELMAFYSHMHCTRMFSNSPTSK